MRTSYLLLQALYRWEALPCCVLGVTNAGRAQKTVQTAALKATTTLLRTPNCMESQDTSTAHLQNIPRCRTSLHRNSESIHPGIRNRWNFPSHLLKSSTCRPHNPVFLVSLFPQNHPSLNRLTKKTLERSTFQSATIQEKWSLRWRFSKPLVFQPRTSAVQVTRLWKFYFFQTRNTKWKLGLREKIFIPYGTKCFVLKDFRTISYWVELYIYRFWTTTVSRETILSGK